MPWHSTFERLTGYAKNHQCTPPFPPTPLILNGWAYSNDVEKMRRWEETVAWANANGCRDVILDIPAEDFYYVEEPTTYTVGPMGGPMYRPWGFESKERPSSEQIARHFETLLSGWSRIVGSELAHITRPVAFTGEKARRLLIYADGSARPPWGGWLHLSTAESERRAFTRFRAAINKAIAPHEVDHVDFTTEESAEQGSLSGAPVAARP